MSTYDISSIKRVLTRKVVKTHVAVVQQQRQRNVQKGVHVQSSCFFFFLLDLWIFYKYSGSTRCTVAQFPCMLLIELILSTDLQTDFFAVVSSLFFV